MISEGLYLFFFFSSRRRHTRYIGDWSSDVCSSDLRSFASASPSSVSTCKRTISASQFDARVNDSTLVMASVSAGVQGVRSEERRVGKECRSRWWPHQYKKKKQASEKLE